MVLSMVIQRFMLFMAFRGEKKESHIKLLKRFSRSIHFESAIDPFGLRATQFFYEMQFKLHNNSKTYIDGI